MADGEEMLTTSEAGALLGVDRHTIARWVRLNQMLAVRLPSGTLRVPRAEVDRVLRELREERERRGE